MQSGCHSRHAHLRRFRQVWGWTGVALSKILRTKWKIISTFCARYRIARRCLSLGRPGKATAISRILYRSQIRSGSARRDACAGLNFAVWRCVRSGRERMANGGWAALPDEGGGSQLSGFQRVMPGLMHFSSVFHRLRRAHAGGREPNQALVIHVFFCCAGSCGVLIHACSWHNRSNSGSSVTVPQAGGRV